MAAAEGCTPRSVKSSGSCSSSTCFMGCLESRRLTLAVFVSVNLVYLLVFGLGKSVISLICYLLLAPLCIGVFLKVLSLTPTEEGPWEIVSRARVAETVDRAYEAANHVMEVARHICCWQDSLLSAKITCGLVALGYISSFFSLPSLLLLVTWLCFCYTFCAALIQQALVPLVHPHVVAAQDFITKCCSAIPRMEHAKKV